MGYCIELLQSRSIDLSTMLKRIAVALILVLSLGLAGCVSAGAGLQSYVDSIDGYRFSYPIGWVQVQLTQSGGPDVVFRDLINNTENISVVINEIPGGDKDLSELGSPTEVGYRLQKSALAPEGSGRTAELVNAEAITAGDKTFYLLEYLVNLPDQTRHDLASVVVHRGQLYTLNASTTEARWNKVKSMMKAVVTSFAVG